MATDLGQHMNLVLCQRQLSAQSLSFEYGKQIIIMQCGKCYNRSKKQLVLPLASGKKYK